MIKRFINLMIKRKKVALFIVPLSIGFIASLAFFSGAVNQSAFANSVVCLPVGKSCTANDLSVHNITIAGGSDLTCLSESDTVSVTLMIDIPHNFKKN